MSRLADALMRPRSVALVGASDDPAKTSGRPQRFLAESGYAGRVMPVNPGRATVQGQQAWPSLAALPEVPDHVFILSPTDSVAAALGECVRLGVPLVTVLADGFSEEGEEGRSREQELRALLEGSRTRLVGPSSIGVVNPRNGLLLTANAAFAEPQARDGRVFVASHSGSMIGALVSRGRARGIGFAGLVSVGNEADLSLGEICEATLDDEGIDGYLLFLESMRHAHALHRFAAAAAARGKPVVAYKLGRSEAAARMAVTHTGALAGEDAVADAFLKDCGIARVGVLDALLETLPLARRVSLRSVRRSRVGVVTTTGGGAAMAVDQLGIRGVTVEPPSEATLARLNSAGVKARPGTVLDLTLAGTRAEVMSAALDVMLSAPEFDLVLATIGSSARLQPELAVAPLLRAGKGEKPLAVMLVPEAPQALATLTEAGIPSFRSPESCADAIAAVFARRPARPPLPHRSAAAGKSLSEFDAYALLDSLDVPHAPAVKLRFDEPLPRLPFEYPVVAKICSADIQHKTEAGGVMLGIRDETSLRDALQQLRANALRHAPSANVEEALVQPMVAGVAEALVGYRVDAEAGPIVMVAAGGIWTELVRERSVRLAPVSVEEAREMVAEVRMLQAAAGRRGQQAGDLEALAQAIAAFSQLATRAEHVLEAEINPLKILPDGVAAVDALVVVAAA
ncbi:acetate--CoA ligase family protein [Ramlibacter albus]|uniref:Acetate--CoA ligase family protein n=1 Tax=Ramlibacter albus TaxID=2079448 RepID=A0A923ME76_9BURK|nr:acetate--CoA ligase family protein [Ramlibacter albus]MBC5767863.1 acetate--CoA ligase family protein [Ramlibacter albus]